MINDVQLEGVLHTFTVQWDIDGAVEGTFLDAEIADGLATTGGVIDKGQQDEEGVFRITQSGEVAIFDLDALGKNACLGERYLLWIRVEPGSAAGLPVGFNVFIVYHEATIDEYIVLQEITAGFVFGGNAFFYLGDIFHVPQGAALLITGVPAPDPGNVNRVKFSVQAGSTALEDAALHRAMCCSGSTGEDDEPVSSVSLQHYDFSALGLLMAAVNFGHYFTWSGSQDASGPTNSALAILAVVAEEDLATIPGATRLTLRTGAVTRLTIRSTAPIIANFFVEASVGGGAFVRTFIATGVAVAANTNEVVAITQFPFVEGTRLRAGYTTDNNAAADVIVELEIATPIP